MRRVWLLEETAEEAVEAAAWYEQECPGLGVEFEREINAALDLLEDEMIPLTSLSSTTDIRGARRLVLGRFPYDIVVRESSHEIIVVAIAHHSRRPGYWRGRLHF